MQIIVQLLLLLSAAYGVPGSFTPVGFGIPPHEGTVITRTEYCIIHDDHSKIPVFAAYVLTAAYLGGSAQRKNVFYPDPFLNPSRRAELADYQKSGYDRGHLIPAGDMTRSAEAMYDTFTLANIAPQLPSFNRGVWKRVEEWTRGYAVKRGKILIKTGAILHTNRSEPAKCIGPGRVAVAPYFYKIILTEEKEKLQAVSFVFPHQASSAPLSEFLTNIDGIELMSGLDFLNLLTEEMQAVIERDLTWGESLFSGTE